MESIVNKITLKIIKNVKQKIKDIHFIFPVVIRIISPSETLKKHNMMARCDNII